MYWDYQKFILCQNEFIYMFNYWKRLNGRTVPPFKMHPGGTVPPFKMHPGGTLHLYQLFFWACILIEEQEKMSARCVRFWIWALEVLCPYPLPLIKLVSIRCMPLCLYWRDSPYISNAPCLLEPSIDRIWPKKPCYSHNSWGKDSKFN